MIKFAIRPIRSGYSFSAPESEVLRAELAGGAGRYRVDIINASEMVSVSWTLLEDGYDYLWRFFRTVGRGAEPFLIDLLLEGPEWVERTARFIPGSLRLDSRDRKAFFVSATLEVEAIEADADYDEAIAAIAQGGLCDMSTYIDLLSTIVNVNWPEV